MKNFKYCFLLAVCFFICGCEGTDQDNILPLTLEVIDNSNPDIVKIVQNSKAPSNCLDVYAGNDESTLIIQASYSFNIMMITVTPHTKSIIPITSTTLGNSMLDGIY